MKKRPRPQEKESIRTGTSPEILYQALMDNLYYLQGRPPEQATKNDLYMALAYTVRDRLLHNWMATLRTIDDDTRVVSYLSAEFLIGPQLGNNPSSLGIWDQVREAITLLGLNFEELLEQEGEPGLGNGGLGGWPPVSWIPWLPWKFPASATASAMNSASSTRKYQMAGK